MFPPTGNAVVSSMPHFDNFSSQKKRPVSESVCFWKPALAPAFMPDFDSRASSGLGRCSDRASFSVPSRTRLGTESDCLFSNPDSERPFTANDDGAPRASREGKREECRSERALHTALTS